MKSILSFIIFLLTSATYAAPAEIGTISCQFDRPRNKSLEAKIFQDGKKTPYAEVEIVKYSNDKRNAIRTVLEKHTLTYVVPKGLSFFFVYENAKEQLRLKAFGDDMGGVSSWEVKNKKTDVTCYIDIQSED